MKRYLSICLLGVLALSLGVAHDTYARQHQAAAMARAGTAIWEVTTGEGSDGATVNLFLPETVHVYAGDTVRWHVQGSIEPHVVAFGPLATLRSLAAHLIVPVPQKAGPPLLAFNPRVAAPTPQTTYDGTDLVHSALLTDGQTYRLTFTKPGTYYYACMIHRGMDGYIHVLPAGGI